MKRNNLKRWLLLLIIPIGVILISLWVFRPNNTEASVPNQKSAAGTSGIQDSPFQKEYLNKGGITVVNVWATWCKPCLQEMPVFQKIITENRNVKFVFLSLDEDPEKLKTYLSKHTINDITFQNKGYIEAIKEFLGGDGILGYNVIPQTFIIKDGKVVDKNLGGIEYQSFTDKLKSFY
ncbi:MULTISPECIES: TlpA family protein disulfide reductase [Chryseobacterium]|uniref:TlpA family protein disulfide reductase n=1 Tax=Chryseobacterium TaxID=59732 RepID=UPI000D129223|nr:TlpA disulfide reductase family protein [Chryseobacterium aurantiacum]